MSMINFDTSTNYGRAKIVAYTTHESHLEGHEITPIMHELMGQYIDGILSIDEVIQKRLNLIG